MFHTYHSKGCVLELVENDHIQSIILYSILTMANLEKELENGHKPDGHCFMSFLQEDNSLLEWDHVSTNCPFNSVYQTAQLVS